MWQIQIGCALGAGSIDLDSILIALYSIDYTETQRFVTFEPLGQGGNPYPAMHGKPTPELLDKLVSDSVNYLRKRENCIKQYI